MLIGRREAYPATSRVLDQHLLDTAVKRHPLAGILPRWLLTVLYTRWAWMLAAAGVALVPFLHGLTGTRVFYIRDLSLYFWGRYLWLRHAWLSGEWPLWDPFVGGGQSAVADALHQMFLPPAILARLLGGDVLGFNLWIALPFPIAACGTWLFLARRHSAAASALGAVAFAACGPVVSTGNFPNMSWSVAAMPWMLWSADRLADRRLPARVAILAVMTACQALAGEPVTLAATLVLVFAFAAIVAIPERQATWRGRAAHMSAILGALALGLLLSAIQLVPLAQATAGSERSDAAFSKDFWSLHPLALLEALWPHLFGDYYTSQSLAAVPWMPLFNSGREPFFFSLYLGVPLLALALLGVFASERRWAWFWTIAGLASLVGAFGGYTPIYPFLREHLPLLGSFRFPVKYLVVVTIAIAAVTASGWDALTLTTTFHSQDVSRRLARASTLAIAFALVVAAMAAGVAAAVLYAEMPTALYLFTSAQQLGSTLPVEAARFMLNQLPSTGSMLLLLSVGVAALLAVARRGSQGMVARRLLYAAIVVDLVVRAWPINPAFDPGYLAAPRWLPATKTDPASRFYIGGKRDGTLDASDPDAPIGFLSASGLVGSASRAVLSGQAAFYPSAWQAREMLSYDLPVLWPQPFTVATKRFMRGTAEERARFLDRTGVRYRALPARLAVGHAPLVDVPYFYDTYLYDWAPVMPRAFVVADARIVADVSTQIERLFAPDWDARTTALVERVPAAAGESSAPVTASAAFVTDTSDRVVIDASADRAGGYLVLLDSYADDWHATVDGHDADVVRANALFRAVHLVPGRHRVEFTYEPRAFRLGAAVSVLALMAVAALLWWPRPQSSSV